MLLETTNTYEATWYLMNGARLKNVVFTKNDNGTLFYKIVVDEIDERFVRYWYQYRPIGNIRVFADTRMELKRKIHEYQNQKSEVSP
jgi:hypothetical protein